MLHDPKWDVKPVLDEVSQHCLRAADYIEKHGWCQHTLKTEDGRVCLMGALAMTNPFGFLVKDSDGIYKPNGDIESFFHVQTQVFQRVCYLIIGTEPGSWNDKAGRTKEQVVALLRKAANEPN